MLENFKRFIDNKVGFLYPSWLRKMSWKMQVLFVLAFLSLIIGGAFFLYQKYIFEILSIAAVIVFSMWLYQSDIGKKMYDWTLDSWRDTKLLVILLIASLFQFLYPITNEFLDRGVDLLYLTVIVFVFYNLFSKKYLVIKIIKWISLIPLWFLTRAFHHNIDVNAIEQFFNLFDLIAIVIVIVIVLFEIFIAKDRATKRWLISLSVILALFTFIFSEYVTQKVIANKRISMLNFQYIDKGDITTYDEISVDETLSNYFFANKNGTDEKTEDSDFVMFNGKPTFVADYLTSYKPTLLNPFSKEKTKGVRFLQLTDNLELFIDYEKAPAIHSTGKFLGDNSISAAAKNLSFTNFFITSFDKVYKKCDDRVKCDTDKWYSVILESSLTDIINPIKIPSSVSFIKHDNNETYNFLWGTGKKVAFKDVVKNYPFMQGEAVISTEVVADFAGSVEYADAFKKLVRKDLIMPDKDENGNINVETLWAEIKGFKGKFARVEFIPKNSKSTLKKDNKTSSIITQSPDVQKVWYFPLFYTGLETDDKKLVVFEDDTSNDGIKAKSSLTNDFNEGTYSKANGYDVFAPTTIIRNDKEFILVALVNNNGVSFNESIIFKIKELGKIKKRSVELKSKTELEAFISK